MLGHSKQVSSPSLVLHSIQADLKGFPACSAPVRIMRVILNLSTDKLLQQMVNVHVMHSSSQLHAGAGGRRIAGALYRLLECMLYLFIGFCPYNFHKAVQ